MATRAPFCPKTTYLRQLRQSIVLVCCIGAITTGGNAQTRFSNNNSALPSNFPTNSAFGEESQFSNVFGYFNAAFGEFSLRQNVSGSNNSAFGYEALYNNTAYYNSAFGYAALFNNTSGQGNSAFGSDALGSNTLGSRNSAFGCNSLINNQVNDLCAFGYNSLRVNSTGWGNSAFGTYALELNTTGYRNSAFGYAVLINNITGFGNSGFGFGSLSLNTFGVANTGSGFASLTANTTGSYNTAHGYGAGSVNVTGECHVALGYETGPSSGALRNTLSIGCNIRVPSSDRGIIGNAAMVSIGGFVGWSNLSDGRFKSDVQENVPGIDFIKKLRPVTYKYDLHAHDKFSGHDESTAADCYPTARDAKETIRYTGFVAQEVEKAATELNFDFSGVDKPQNDQTPYGLRYAEFVVPLVKAVQEQQSVIEAQEKNAQTQQRKIEEYERNSQQQKENIGSLQTELSSMRQRLERLEQLLVSQEKAGAEMTETGDNSSLQVYPNPTDGIVKVSIKNEAGQQVRLQLADVAGKVLVTRSVSDSMINTSFDLSGYPAGNYMLTVTKGAETMSKVIVFGGK